MQNNNILTEIEKSIRDNEFKNKDELNNYLNYLVESGALREYQETEWIKKFLDLYDELYPETEQSLNIENYKGVSLEDKQFIVSTQDDRILKTNEEIDKIDEEFKKTQNELLATNKGETVTADEVFEHMADNQKEELSLIPLTEINKIDNVKIETLQKIKFFINNKYVNPYDYQIDISNDIFYNITTKEMFEVRKNEETNEYAIYKGGEVVYKENNQEELTMENEEITNNEAIEKDEEKQLYERKDDVKRRILAPPKHFPNNKAFSNISFLVLNIITFILLITMIFFLNK